jgi:hypothetical protein
MSFAAPAAAVLVLLPVGNIAAFMHGGYQGMFFEMQLGRTWNKICENLGGTFKMEARSFRNGLIGAYGRGETKTVYPKLCGVQGTREAWQGLIKPNPGQRLDDYTKNEDAFTLAFQVQSVTFQIAQKGCISIKAGYMQVPATYDFEE